MYGRSFRELLQVGLQFGYPLFPFFIPLWRLEHFPEFIVHKQTPACRSAGGAQHEWIQHPATDCILDYIPN